LFLLLSCGVTESIDGVVGAIEVAECEISTTEENLRSTDDVCLNRYTLEVLWILVK
jgi:hypothetical protein